ncbi:MAG: hypothetical protein OXP71_09025 [Candidatus Poribacteria bacterium]|nr:hypothetical protein [Candidatus Poribacteria bacterium]
MRLVLRLIVLFAVMCVWGCGITKYNVVVSRDVPDDPTFTVVPANDQIREVTFANEVENAIITAGVKVVRFYRPTPTEVTKEASLGEEQAGKKLRAEPYEMEEKAAAQKGSARVTKKYIESEGGVQADYYVETYSYRRHVKISNGEEVLAVFDAEPLPLSQAVFVNDVETDGIRSWELKMHAVLSKMGISENPLTSYARIVAK